MEIKEIFEKLYEYSNNNSIMKYFLPCYFN